MGDQGTVWLPEAASTVAGDVDALFYFILWVSTILFIGVIGTMVLFAWRFRRRSSQDRPQPVRENKLIEASWIVVPTLLVAIVFVWGFRVFLELGIAPPNSYEIDVRARKWSWLFEYSSGAQSSELHVPVHRPVKLRMISEDVIHSFFVPAFRVKADVFAGRYSYVWFEATRQDTFVVACAEYCGMAHSQMLTRVVVHSQDDFENWLADNAADADMTPAERGERLYSQQGCFACHSLDGIELTGPSFQGLAGSTRMFTDGTSAEADANYLRQAIVNPAAEIVQGYEALMPGTYSSLSAADLDALVAFIEAQ
ncbi:MAG: cytochrome c oxidase subunit II [Bacteroidota bacterium]|nr:cytochrome c oxidase subunit II [Bacteroidota bacterium]MDE2834845.1 cytochrome c oxidase subunit II [Bacteroidota bacterium]